MRDPREASLIAVERRRARASVKRALQTGERDPLAVARNAWVSVESAEFGLRVTEFLGSIPGIGAVKIPRILESLGISPRKRLGALGPHQIDRLTAWLDERQSDPKTSSVRGRLIVLAGPTAVGKGTVVARIRASNPDVRFSVSATTRAPRPGESNGEHYFFVSDSEFDRLVHTDQMLEWAVVHGQNRYGTPRGPIVDALRAGDSIILEIDIQGARQVKKAMPEAILVFLMPPSWEELVRRLESRATESPEEQMRRLETAKVEFAAKSEFDVIVVNDDVDSAAEAVVQLMKVNNAEGAS
jgi:guanylate kinase